MARLLKNESAALRQIRAQRDGESMVQATLEDANGVVHDINSHADIYRVMAIKRHSWWRRFKAWADG